MRKPRAVLGIEPISIPPLPGWIGSNTAENAETAAFRAGAALAHLGTVGAAKDLPLALWRDRLALRAAEVCVGVFGRRDGPGALRDAVHLTRAGDDPGPAGKVFRQWSRAVGRPITVGHLAKVLDGLSPERIGMCLDVTGGTPVERAANVLEAVLDGNPRAEAEALILADAVLATAIGQTHILPLLALALKPRELLLRREELRLACYRAVGTGAGQAVPLAAELVRAAARLRAVAPMLRAKGAEKAVEMFLAQDALTPGALSFMSDRAARRLCDRLVELSAVRELTGRDTFRLYGL